MIRLAPWFVVAFYIVRASIAWLDPGMISWPIRMFMHHVLLVRRRSAVLDPKLYNALGKVVVLINEVILGQAFWFRCRFDVFQRSHVIPISTDEASWDVQLIGNKVVRNHIMREILHVSIVQQNFTHLLPSLHRPCTSIRAAFNEILLRIFH